MASGSKTDTDGRVFAVVADPQEERVVVDANCEAIICTGDLLNFAPKPYAPVSVDKSLLHEYDPGVGELYEEGDVAAILHKVKEAAADEEVFNAAVDRYHRFFDELDSPLYYIFGNLDIPAALERAAAEHEEVRPVHELDSVAGADGFVPEFSPLPCAGCFPGEVAKEAYLRQLRAAHGAKLVVAHDVPPRGFSAYNVQKAVASAPMRETANRNGFIPLEPYPTSGYRLLTINGDGRGKA